MNNLIKLELKYKSVLDGEVENDSEKIGNFVHFVLPYLNKQEKVVEVDKHSKRVYERMKFVCGFMCCRAKEQTFATKQVLIRHLRTLHADELPGNGDFLAPGDHSVSSGYRLVCTNCNLRFNRTDKLRDHKLRYCSRIININLDEEDDEEAAAAAGKAEESSKVEIVEEPEVAVVSTDSSKTDELQMVKSLSCFSIKDDDDDNAADEIKVLAESNVDNNNNNNTKRLRTSESTDSISCGQKSTSTNSKRIKHYDDENNNEYDADDDEDELEKDLLLIKYLTAYESTMNNINKNKSA